jgi:serine phosphatase RsbU (regulator of sigma subunit)
MTQQKATHGIHTASGYGGLSVTARVLLTIGLGMLAVAGALFYFGRSRSAAIALELQERALVDGLPLTGRKPAFERKGDTNRLGENRVARTSVELGGDEGTATLYEYQVLEYVGDPDSVLVPASAQDAEGAFTGLWLTIALALVGVGLVLGFVVAEQVKVPLNRIMERIRQMSGEGDRTRTSPGKVESVEVLAHSVGRVSRQLSQAREVEQELSVRQRELDLAAGVREALLPQHTPAPRGWSIAARHLSSDRFGGDFHDFIEPSDALLGVLVCDVSGQGVPAAMIGGAARSYLRSELLRGGELGDALKRVNHELGRDVRRGMYVSALYLLIELSTGRARIACAGHKAPLLRIASADGKLRTLQPEGIALGLDKGPVFDRTLKVAQIEIEPGDRLVLTTTGPLRMPDPAGNELGEKAFYAAVVRNAAKSPHDCLDAIRAQLEKHAGSTELPVECSLVALSREPVA